MLFALLEVIQSQRHGFMPPQSAREQQCEQCSVTFSFQSLMIRGLAKVLGPAPQSANASRQIGAEETAVGGLVCKPAHGTET
jgi:hypothetical protein